MSISILYFDLKRIDVYKNNQVLDCIWYGSVSEGNSTGEVVRGLTTLILYA